jgi:hypothetical protein
MVAVMRDRLLMHIQARWPEARNLRVADIELRCLARIKVLPQSHSFHKYAVAASKSGGCMIRTVPDLSRDGFQGSDLLDENSFCAIACCGRFHRPCGNLFRPSPRLFQPV